MTQTKITEINAYLTEAINDACGDPTFTMELFGLCHKRTVQNDTYIVRPVEDGTNTIISLDSTKTLIGYHLVSGGGSTETEGYGEFSEINNSHNARLVIASTDLVAIWVIIQELQSNVSNVVFERYTADAEQILQNDFAIDLEKKGYPDDMVAYSIEYLIYE